MALPAGRTTVLNGEELADTVLAVPQLTRIDRFAVGIVGTADLAKERGSVAAHVVDAGIACAFVVVLANR